MISVQGLHRLAIGLGAFAIAALGIAACSREQAPAKKMIQDIDAAVAAALPDAATYLPDQLKDVQSKLGEFKADFDKQDYKDVVSGAPAVLSNAQGLASAAAAKKSLVVRGFTNEWTSMASTLPEHATEIQNRVDFLSQPANKKMAAGVDLNAVKSGLSEAAQSWSQAQAQFSGGKLEEAVAMAKTVKTKYDALAASMKLDFTEPAAVRDTAP